MKLPRPLNEDFREQARSQSQQRPRKKGTEDRAGQSARQQKRLAPWLEHPDHSRSKARARHRIVRAGDRRANPHTDILKRARAVAEAQIELARIRAARHQVAQDDESNAHRKFAQLIALDRYERRAMSRRKFAVRMFNGLPRCKRAINNQANR